jgi:hypothetical protein
MPKQSGNLHGEGLPSTNGGPQNPANHTDRAVWGLAPPALRIISSGAKWQSGYLDLNQDFSCSQNRCHDQVRRYPVDGRRDFYVRTESPFTFPSWVSTWQRCCTSCYLSLTFQGASDEASPNHTYSIGGFGVKVNEGNRTERDGKPPTDGSPP